MKQSTRLLSVLLAMIMLFGVLAVGVEAAVRRNVVITKGNVNYDSIDDVALTTDQVATLICDELDKLLLEANIYEDITIATLDLRSLDAAFKSLYDLLGNILISSATVKDVAKLKNERGLLNRKRTDSGGDVDMLVRFIGFLTKDSEVRGVLSKIAYGIENGSNSLQVGSILKGILGSKLAMLNDLPALLRGLLFDEIIRGTYAYPEPGDVDLYVTAPTTTYEKWDKLSTKPFTNTDTLLNTFIHNLLTKPMDKEWVYNAATGLMEKKYDEDSKILPTIAASAINLNNNSLMQIIDNVLDLAYTKLGVAPLNHDLKKLLMKELGVDFIEVKNPSSGLLGAFNAIPEAKIKNYFVNAATFKYNGVWYFSDYVTRGVDANGDGKTDRDANDREITQKVRRFFKADDSDVDVLYGIINWDYEFTAETYNFANGITTYGSLIGQLNHLLYTFGNTMLSTEMKDAIKAFNGTADFAVDGGNANLVSNLFNIVKFVVCEYAGKIFYKNPDFVDENDVILPEVKAAIIAAANFENLAAYIAIPLMNKILPELILPKAFTLNSEIEQMAALLLREALSDITPALNFDARIFKADTLTSADGRELAVKTKEEWRTLVLDMGMNLAMIYLDNKTNINVDTAAAAAIFAQDPDAGWKPLFEEVVDWGISYLGTGTNGILSGFAPGNLGVVRGTYNGNAMLNLNKVLNALLPLDLIVGCKNGTAYACDVEYLVFQKLLPGVFDLNFDLLLSVFGRAGGTENLLTGRNALETILRLVARIVNVVLPGAIPVSHVSNLNTFVSQAGLKALIAALLGALNTRVYAGGGTTGLLYSGLLPLISKFVSDWSGEQKIGSPLIEMESTYAATSGTLTGATFTITNGAKGLWRGYMDGTRKQDEHYKYRITSVTATTTAGTVTPSAAATTLDFGVGMSASFNVTGIPTVGAVVLFAINYQVYNEEGGFMGGGKTFTAYRYAYVTYNPTDDGNEVGKTHKSDSKMQFGLYTPQYIPLESGAGTIPNRNTAYFNVEYTNYTGYTPCKAQIQTVPAAQKGISIATTGEIEIPKETKTKWASFTVNEDQYNAAAITSGTVLNWPITLMMRNRKMGLTGGQSDTYAGTLVMKFYSANDLSDLKDLTNDEIGAVKLQANYNIGDVYANKLLRFTAISEDEPKETNFNTTGIDPETEELVTIIDGATAWTNYKAALNAAIRGAYQVWNANSVYNHKELAENLRIAISDINLCRKSAEQLADEGAESNDVAVLALKAIYDARVPEIDSYKDYMLYRWDRYKDSEGAAYRLISAFEAAQAVVDTEVFPYGNINITELNALLAKDGVYANYINALRKARTAEEIEASHEAKTKAEENYSRGYTAQDVEQITSLFQRTADRLVPREGGTKTEYLATELASALAIYGNAATSNKYSAKSWDVYLDRLATAQAELQNPKNNHTVFEAKYHLQKAVNELILIENGANYDDLEDAIATAEAVLANHELFLQGQDKVIGLVLAALGYKIDGTELFPGAAKDVVNTPYEAKNQRKIDDAELKLRMALANVRYATTTVDPNTGATTEDQPETDAYFAFVPANLAIANVYGYIDAVVPANVTNVAPVTITPNATHAGTGTVVTFYGTLNGNTIPVASYSVVVIGDVTGDSAIDSADVMLADLVVNEHKEVDGAFLKAALADPATAAGGVVTIAALSEIVNIAVGK